MFGQGTDDWDYSMLGGDDTGEDIADLVQEANQDASPPSPPGSEIIIPVPDSLEETLSAQRNGTKTGLENQQEAQEVTLTLRGGSIRSSGEACAAGDPNHGGDVEISRGGFCDVDLVNWGDDGAGMRAEDENGPGEREIQAVEAEAEETEAKTKEEETEAQKTITKDGEAEEKQEGS